MKNILKNLLGDKNKMGSVAMHKKPSVVDSLKVGNIDTQYTIRAIETDDEEMKKFLFTLGCYEGENVTIISKLSANIVISVKDARYSIDTELADAIII